MNKKNISWKEKFENNNKGHKCPLTDEVVYSNMIYKYYKPYKLYEYLKDRFKHLINYNTKIPTLYYNNKIDFAFFPRPPNEIMDIIYDDSHINSTYGNNFNIDDEIKNAKSKTRNSSAYFTWQWIEKASSTVNFDIKNVLDYGAGSGWLSYFLSSLKLQVTATDISTKVMQTIPLIDKKIKVLPLKSLGNNSEYDLIVSFDVFEHLSDPVKSLSMLIKNLKNNGLVFISVPNFSSYFSKINLSKHPYFCYPDHLNYFTPSSLEILFERVSMKVLQCETITQGWEKEYIRRYYTNDEVGLKGYRLYDKWSEPGNGERIYCIAQKTE